MFPMSPRRRFLQFLAASPLFAQSAPIIANPEEAMSLLDFEAACRQALPPAHFGYMATGVDDDATLRANREAFSRFQIRPRRLVDVSHVSLQTTLFGTTWETPILLAPVGSQKAFHPEGEIAVARAAGKRKTLQILSTMTTAGIEDVAEANGRPIWYQLYTTSKLEVGEELAARAGGAGCPVLVLTIDTQAGRNTETFLRSKRVDTRKCTVCHDPAPGGFFQRKPMFKGIDMAAVATGNPSLTWSYVDRLRKLTKMKLVIKGIVTHEDARLAIEHGADGIVVSNHGGRAEESGRGTIECLPEVAEAVAGRVPILLDGGIRRGTDILKAMALGASAVCIGRPYIWGLAAFGQPGVERVLEILQAELTLALKQSGRKSLAELDRTVIAMR